MNSIRDDYVGLDTNEFVFALRRDPQFTTCATLLFERPDELRIHIPLQVFVELQRNLNSAEMRIAVDLVDEAAAVNWDYAPVTREAVETWERLGAKKGDAVIAAQMAAAGTSVLVSENRHFLAEMSGLPFEVITSAEILRLLDAETDGEDFSE